MKCKAINGGDGERVKRISQQRSKYILEMDFLKEEKYDRWII